MIKQCAIKRVNNKEYRCFFELALQIMGGKWKPVIIYHLAQQGTVRYGVLRRTLDGVSERMFSRQLKELEEDGLIKREAYPEVPPRVEYSLTEIGSKMLPSLMALRQFGIEYEKYMGNGELIFNPEEYESLDNPFADKLENSHSAES